MPNMSHCRFENTLKDLEDCQETLDQNGVQSILDNASEYEKPAVRKLIALCKAIADDHHEEW